MVSIEPLRIEIDREDDGRFLASVPDLPGVHVVPACRNVGAEGEAVWNVLKEKGWIAETDGTTASVKAKDLRAPKDLGDDWAEKQPAIELLLVASYIGQVSTQATFSSRQSVVEGWLKLRSTDDTSAAK